jgi:hypothetical protein
MDFLVQHHFTPPLDVSPCSDGQNGQDVDGKEIEPTEDSRLVSWRSVVAPSRIHVSEATALDTLMFARNKDPGDSAEMDKSSAYSPLGRD